jgi:hypothetical protein
MDSKSVTDETTFLELHAFRRLLPIGHWALIGIKLQHNLRSLQTFGVPIISHVVDKVVSMKLSQPMHMLYQRRNVPAVLIQAIQVLQAESHQ